MKISCAIALALLSLNASAETVMGNRPDCQVVLENPKPEETVQWNGPCKDGFAEDEGVLQWQLQGKETSRYEGPLVRGVKEGDGALRDAKGRIFSGMFRQGHLHGKAALSVDKCYRLEGEFDHGRLVGPVKVLYISGDQYEGEWREGKPHGQGVMRYGTGGLYAGLWQNGLRHGQGEITYSNGLKRSGDFSAGIIEGGTPNPSTDTKYNLKGDSESAYSLFTPMVANATLPFNKSYAELTPEQQRIARSAFPALQDGDVPPYPAHGTASVMRAVSKAMQIRPQEGELWMDVLVDEQGKPTSSTVRMAPDKEIANFAGNLLLISKFTPAVCGGKPCPMSYSFHMQLRKRL